MKKGFTLVELLAVIIILGILIAITVPMVDDIISNSKDRLYSVAIEQIKNGAKDYALQYGDDVEGLETDGVGAVTIEQLVNEGVLEAPVINPKTGESFDSNSAVKITLLDNGNYEFEFFINGVSDIYRPVITMTGTSPISIYQGDAYVDAGATALDNVDGNLSSSVVTTSTVNINTVGTYTVTYNVTDAAGNTAIPVVRTVNVLLNPVNEPLLATGMTPIKWNGSSWENTTTDDPDWYSYTATNKKWANAKTADGSMWVWIPRYIYRISSNWHTSTTGAGDVDVKFSVGTDDTRNGTLTLDTGTTSAASNAATNGNKYTNHPAFWWDNDSDGVRENGEELTGIWVAKFETTAAEGVANTTFTTGPCSDTVSDNVTTKTAKIIPNATPWRCIKIGNAFTVARSMEAKDTYGWGTSGNGIDTHLMKNTEWGAISYLSKSIYGKNTEEIWINPATNGTTGCAGDSKSSSSTATCLNTYNTTNGVKASSTGTIYGIYDIVGGARELIAAYVNNGSGNLSTFGNEVLSAANKYKNVYTVGSPDSRTNNYDLTLNSKGDALYEVSLNSNGNCAWYGDSAAMPYTDTPWFVRGGRFDFTTLCGSFNFDYGSGNPLNPDGFRPVLLVGTGF